MRKPKVPAPALDQDAERMRDGADRLAELLRDPGPGIKVTPIAERLADGRSVPLDGQVADTPTPQHQSSTPDKPAQHPADQTYASPQHALQARLERAAAGRIRPATEAAASRPARTRQKPKNSAATPAGRNARRAQQADPRDVASESVSIGRIDSKPPGLLADLEKRVDGAGERPAPPPQANATPKRAQPITEAVASKSAQASELGAALRSSRDAFVSAAMFSFVINLLMLAGPLFMLQVYDRVMTSGSVPTLIALSIFTFGAYAVIGILELVRSRVIVRVGMEVDARVTTRVFEAALKRSVGGTGHSVPALRELDSLRQFLAGQGPLTFFDAPWTPVYLLVIFLMHWMLGVAAACGALILLTLAWLSEVRSRKPILEAGRAAGRSLEMAETGQRNAEAILAMGMTTAFRQRWQSTNQNALAWQMQAADRLGAMTAASKSLRLLLQSMMLAIGAYLALQSEISAGVIVAATIIFGRALAPVEQAIGQWRSFLKARESYAKIDELLQKEPATRRRTELPAPTGHLAVRSLRVAAPQNRQLILANVNFDVRPGEMLAVIGPSASGKSSLVRALVGLWAPASGSITLDGSRLDHWDPEDLGQHIGYLPQAVELFAGTVK
ncbi:MAG: ATP-binding cassette domain-containing protein, partial [Pseudomonadota bacterium]